MEAMCGDDLKQKGTMVHECFNISQVLWEVLWALWDSE
jgi:hypothetical protein